MSAPELLCFFCNGKLTHRGNSAKISVKGIHTLRIASEDQSDPISIKEENANNSDEFDWSSRCFICGKNDFRKQLTDVTTKADEIRARIIGKLDSNDNLYERLTSSPNLLVVKARYRKKCYAPYCKNPSTQLPEKKVSVNDLYGKVAMSVWNDQRDAINNGEIFYSSELREIFIHHMILNGSNSEEANGIRSSQIKSALIKSVKEEFTFHSKSGCPDIACASNVSIYDLLKRIKESAPSTRQDRDPQIDYDSKTLQIHQKVLFIARGKVVPPSQLGLALDIWHDCASRKVIGILNSCGFCVSYTELRRFLTSAALSSENSVPRGIIVRSKGGLLVHGENDNLDWNVQTIDGKVTYHVLARVVFQDKKLEDDSIENVRIPRLNEKTLAGKEEFKSYTSTVHYEKPTKRPEPKQYNNAPGQINQLIIHQEKLAVTKDTSWVLARDSCQNSSRQNLDELSVSTQKIPIFKDGDASFTELFEKIKSFCEDYPNDTTRAEFEALLIDVSNEFLPALEKFRQMGRSKSPTFRY
ncbi:hypothetical protein QAD02_013056 [Eretmocerus hayati]|uniref:Uncharacterized protein n=1 Tax=Eretmocerus hayati TaxID=131215 RepID=A0ACC2P405_9HYME|nr:hypothetical protein QAD02_013056 [Eretmocerus hayati]